MTADQHSAGLAWTEINSATPGGKKKTGAWMRLGKARSLFSEVKRMELQSTKFSLLVEPVVGPA